jgi:hypothetical protein
MASADRLRALVDLSRALSSSLDLEDVLIRLWRGRFLGGIPPHVREGFGHLLVGQAFLPHDLANFVVSHAASD